MHNHDLLDNGTLDNTVLTYVFCQDSYNSMDL